MNRTIRIMQALGNVILSLATLLGAFYVLYEVLVLQGNQKKENED